VFICLIFYRYNIEVKQCRAGFLGEVSDFGLILYVLQRMAIINYMQMYTPQVANEI
jgi:hypothetical protein